MTQAFTLHTGPSSAPLDGASSATTATSSTATSSTTTTSSTTATSTTTATGRTPRPNARLNAFVLRLRRLHLDLGLLLAPAALIYAASGFVFNHGGWFSDGRDTPFEVPAARGALPPADTLAAELVTALGPGVTLAAEPAPRLQGDVVLQVEERPGTPRQQVRVDVATGRGVLRAGGIADDKAPFVERKVDLVSREELAALTSEVRAALVAAGADLGDAKLSARGAPTLRSVVEHGGRQWLVTTRLGSRDVEARPVAPSDLGPVDLVTRLHLAHGYPTQPGVRTAWAVVVDLMALALAFWAISGLVMWWQMRTLRRRGVAILGVSLAGMTALVIGMAALFG